MTTSKRSAELDEIWSLFAQEGKENLALAEETLLKLEQDLDDSEQVKVLFRALHSFKGGARMMGLGVLESLAHHAEDLIALVRDDGVALQLDIIDLLLAVLDRLRAMLDDVLVDGQDVEPSQAEKLIDALQQMIAKNQRVTPGVEASIAQVSRDEISFAASPTETAAEAVLVPAEATPVQSVQSAPIEVQAETTIETIPTQPILPVPTDANDLADFLVTAERVLSHLHPALIAFENGTVDAGTQIRSVANELIAVATQQGYLRLVSIAENLDHEASASEQASVTLDERAEYLLRLHKVEFEIFEELTRLQDQARPSDTPEAGRWGEIAWLFRHWNAERVYADLARLSEIADLLDQVTHQLTVETSIARQSEKSAEEATVRLKAIYHSCIFYHLDLAVHLTLALEDL
ncbi:partial Chemotaxis protein CheA, partial [Anaerolineae bacterium]